MSNDDPIALLERELLGAARRRATRLPREPAAPGRARRLSVGGMLTAVAAVAAAAVAVGALALLGGRPSSVTTGRLTPRQQLIDILGVLRRPQTAADLSLVELSRSKRPHAVFQPLDGTPDRPLIRLATVAPWGARVFLVPFRPATARQLARLPRGWTAYAPIARGRAARDETLGIFASGAGAGSITALAVERGRAISSSGGSGVGGRPPSPLRLIVVVPDGVAKVGFELQRRAGDGSDLVSTTVSVHGNVAAVQADHAAQANPRVMTWFGPSGNVIKRVRPGQR